MYGANVLRLRLRAGAPPNGGICKWIITDFQMLGTLKTTLYGHKYLNILRLIYIYTYTRIMQQEVSISLALCVGQMQQLPVGLKDLFRGTDFRTYTYTPVSKPAKQRPYKITDIVPRTFWKAINIFCKPLVVIVGYIFTSKINWFKYVFLNFIYLSILGYSSASFTSYR